MNLKNNNYWREDQISLSSRTSKKFVSEEARKALEVKS